jgi:hypothetical protein
MLCIIMLTLHELFPHDFYTKKIQEWLEDYSHSCRIMDEYEQDGVYDYKMKQLTDENKINTDDCIRIVRKHLNHYNRQNTFVLAENVKLALVQLSCDYGFGKKRLDRLVKALLSTDRPNALEDVKKFGIDYDPDFSTVDHRKMLPKKQKIRVDYNEITQIRRDLSALKNYQDSINGDTNGD